MKKQFGQTGNSYQKNNNRRDYRNSIELDPIFFHYGKPEVDKRERRLRKKLDKRDFDYDD